MNQLGKIYSITSVKCLWNNIKLHGVNNNLLKGGGKLKKKWILKEGREKINEKIMKITNFPSWITNDFMPGLKIYVKSVPKSMFFRCHGYHLTKGGAELEKNLVWKEGTEEIKWKNHENNEKTVDIHRIIKDSMFRIWN